MDSDDTQQPVVTEPAGQQLKRAREQKGLTVSAVADAQHLRPAVIHAIEDGAYEQIDSELFLKGYVRAYALQVGLNPDTVIATLDRELEPLRQQKAQAEELNPLVDIERRRRQKRRIAKLLFFALVIAILVVVGLRFLDTPGSSVAPDEPDTSEAPADMIEPLESGPEGGDVSETVTDTGENADVAETIPAGTEPANDTQNDQRVSTPAPLEGQEEIPLVADRDSGEASRPVREPALESPRALDESRVPVVTSAPEPAFQESAEPDAAAGRAQLEMTFRDECWVQVTDSAGNRLVGSLQQDGDRVEVSGRVPIQVIVGAVDAVESIRFDGEPVDMSDFRVVNNRAEFALDI
ncbi:DUF4115 domain-containing protein [Marinobacter vulgaris]|uniref:DUF4115 domain-containing protein n=1 Tax=Marinobacter vulgaris TaxID=1928331 RepID=A0A2V3ZLB1_9GAMM|nr:RodZ domain-containing protein [Marinobacter vulgaris]PXX91688.1 DUF4115 domain-containing protein [Marinobacter vulgaris]TSJ70808.1 helix-turn-helix domain-containing protein [Marinobacter vulgaris]